MAKKPTAKQRLAAEKIADNIRSDNPKTTGEILREVGYSEEVSLTPTKVTESKGFLQVLEEAGVTDDRIAKVMEEGLNATRRVGDGELDPDYAVRHKYMETALKVKNHQAEGVAGTGNIYNTFIQQNYIDPNSEENKRKIEAINKAMMGEI